MPDANEILSATGNLDPYQVVPLEPPGRQENFDRVTKEDWPEPIPISSLNRPCFPLNALPTTIRSFVSQAAAATQTPVDMSAMFALAALATSSAGHVRVRLNADWIEPTNIFVAVAMPPASRKSPVCKLVFEPIYEFERAWLDSVAPDIAQAQAKYDVLREQVADAKKKVVGHSSADKRRAAEQELADLVDRLHHERVPPPPRLVVDDATPEKVASLLHEQNGCLAVISAEGGGLFELMSGRYSKNGAPNFDVYLKGHSGDHLRVDRKNSDCFAVAAPALTLGLAIQPSVLLDLGKRGDFRGRGLLGRFLFVIPESTLGSRLVDPPAIPREIRRAYEDLVTGLCAWKRAESDPIDLRLSQESRQRWNAFAADLEPALGPGGAAESISDWAGKLVGTIARIAALLHMAQQADRARPSIEIDACTMNDAIQIGRYLLSHAQAAFSHMQVDCHELQAQRLLAWLRRTNLYEFTYRDAFSSLRSNDIRRSAHLEKPLEILMERHFVRVLPETEPRSPGRPSRRYEVNPLTHNTQ